MDEEGHTATISVRAHPSLDLAAFRTHFPEPLGSIASPDWLVELLNVSVAAPVSRFAEIGPAVRDMLRTGGYKPAGRGKPASEYLVRTAESTGLSSINLAVDACNAVSLHSGLPSSVVDAARVSGRLRVAEGSEEDSYVFNASGQVIKVAGLLCLFDAAGPCANAVKDAQRTKTSPDTQETISLIWGVRSYHEHTVRTVAWYKDLLERAGAAVEDITLETPA